MSTPLADINGHIITMAQEQKQEQAQAQLGSVLLFRSAVRRAQNTLKVIQQMARRWR